MRARATWALTDQALSSLSNFALTVLVARLVTRDQFGEFTIAYAIYLIAVGVGQGLGSGPLAVRYSTSEPGRFRTAAADVTGVSLLVGGIMGLGCLAASLVAPRSVGGALVVIGIALPGLLLQDAWRFVFVVGSRPQQAVVNDGVWMAAQVIGFALLIALKLQSAVSLLTVWAAAGSVAAVVGCAQSGVLPRPQGALRWIRREARLAVRYAIESLVVRGATSLSWVIIAVLAGPGALAAVRGAQVLFSPLSLIYLAGLYAAVPEAARLLRRSHRAFQMLVLSIAGASAAAATVLWVALIVGGDNLGPQALGLTWQAARLLILPVAVQNVLTGLSMGPQVGLRALAAAKRSLSSQVLQGAGILAATAVGTALAGAQGAATGIAAGTALGLIWWWTGFLEETGRAPAT
jgi:hypothetical protein